MEKRKNLPDRKDGRVIIHFDYDCFYASVVEASNPALRHQPLAIQQKQIIVTCNYTARARGLYKLQLITDARRMCPDLVVVLGEDISRFRDASKALYNYLKEFSWNGRVERLGFDEVWLDVTDVVDWNLEGLNRGDLGNSFFQTQKGKPEEGFAFDARACAGGVFPPSSSRSKEKELGGTMPMIHAQGAEDELTMRLRLGSHFAMHIRHQLEEHQGYTSTVGIATNKLLSKLVGNVNKPKGQTTLLPPLDAIEGQDSNVSAFLDRHDIGKIPGIGFKLAQKLREFVLQRPPDFDAGLVYGGTKENITVADVRNHPEINSEMLEQLLGGPGSPHGIGHKVWCLLHGIDDTEVSEARAVPRQISIEDSYIRLDTMPEVIKELTTLSKSLLTRMRIDLLGYDDEDDFKENDDDNNNNNYTNGNNQTISDMPKSNPTHSKKWLAHPRTLRLTTRPRQPLRADGTRVRSFKRISHSAPLPNFVFNLHDSIDALAERLVRESLMQMFRKLHPERAGWNLSLVNLGVTNLAEAAGKGKGAEGRDIGGMFRRQEDVLKDFRVTDPGDENERIEEVVEGQKVDLEGFGQTAAAEEEGEEAKTFYAGQMRPEPDAPSDGRYDGGVEIENGGDEGWIEDEVESGDLQFCEICDSHVPAFAMLAHRRFHSPGAE